MANEGINKDGTTWEEHGRVLTEMQDLALQDLDATRRLLYVAALRYVRAFERDEIDHKHDEGIPVGYAAGELYDAAVRDHESYDRAESSGVWGEIGED
jgi:hypothetical protein